MGQSILRPTFTTGAANPDHALPAFPFVQVQVSQLEVGWDAAQQGFADLENRVTSVTQAATQIGNRLQVRVQALPAMRSRGSVMPPEAPACTLLASVLASQ